MLIRVTMDLCFNIANQAQAQALRAALVPFAQYAVNINEGQPDEEIGYIQAARCYHDEVPLLPCEVLARYEIGTGWVIGP